MAKEMNILGVGNLELGVVGDGVMGATLTSFTDIEVNSMSFEGEQIAEEVIPVENDDNYLIVDGKTTPAKFKFRLFGVDLADYPLLMGGTFATGTWSAPKAKVGIYLSTRLTSIIVNGVKRIIEIPYGKVNAKVQGNITKNGLPAVDIEVTAQTPVTALGVEGAPYTIADA